MAFITRYHFKRSCFALSSLVVRSDSSMLVTICKALSGLSHIHLSTSSSTLKVSLFLAPLQETIVIAVIISSIFLILIKIFPLVRQIYNKKQEQRHYQHHSCISNTPRPAISPRHTRPDRASISKIHENSV